MTYLWDKPRFESPDFRELFASYDSKDAYTQKLIATIHNLYMCLDYSICYNEACDEMINSLKAKHVDMYRKHGLGDLHGPV